jgi:hypothetical protein
MAVGQMINLSVKHNALTSAFEEDVLHLGTSTTPITSQLLLMVWILK